MGAHTFDVNESEFKQEVLDSDTPVLVDFWAEWCGPCKTLGPILEELTESYGGAFRMAKVDVDANPMLASQFGAQSIPMVFALFKGGLVDRFAGAMPRQELKRFIDSVLERCGVAIPDLEAAQAAPPANDAEREAVLRARVAENGDDGEALVDLGRLEMERGQRDQARELFAAVPPSHDAHIGAQNLIAVLELADRTEEAGGESSFRDRLAAEPEAVAPRYYVACADGARGRFPEAIGALVDLVAARDAEFSADAQRAAATLLEAAGRGDELVEQHRRRLSRLLF